MKRRRLAPAALIALLAAVASGAGAVESATEQPLPDIAALVSSFKTDPRGPYQAIRWFCPDGSILPPQERCPEPGGVQHALIKDNVRSLARDHGIYLGQILAGTPDEEFWTPDGQYGRAKQFILERYLVATDDGWIERRARYYRGAYQIEDEEAWGQKFLTRLLGDDRTVAGRFFLLRQLGLWLPHRSQDDRLIRIRSLAQRIAETEPRFMDLRVKIHSQPDASDLVSVRTFRERHVASLDSLNTALLLDLEADLEQSRRMAGPDALASYRPQLTPWPSVLSQLETVLKSLDGAEPGARGCTELAELLWRTRSDMLTSAAPERRLVLLDLSLDTERLLFRRIAEWRPEDLRGLAARAFLLVKAAAGCGFLEVWEWEAIAGQLEPPTGDRIVPAAEFAGRAALTGRTVEWCSGMAAATFAPAIEAYRFEPLGAGFVDASLRSSVVLALGETASRMAEIAAAVSGVHSRVMDLPDLGGLRGMNPGYACGPLEVVTGSPETVTFAPDRIYALLRPASDLSPVAGILTVSEGNPVSHIQLLARNLGIPNAVLTGRHLESLLPYSGSPVFYAVSPRGAVLMKPASEMTPEESRLVTTEQRRDDMVRVPIDRIDLNETGILDLRDLRAGDSGRLCGPKAANLGQLKHLFPEHVVEGLVLPFGLFFAHMNQPLPDSDTTYWQWLQNAFARADLDRRSGVSATDVEQRIIEDLARFREMIGAMPFLPGFEKELAQRFAQVLGSQPGDGPVFLRSDTNMEDLRDFTGAGLNLTLINVRDRDAILQGIRAVWASPYSERSYRWRQRFLLNPENVFPSILILPSVNVEKSGVMITTGIAGGAVSDFTVAFNRGVAGAVEGQIAESYRLGGGDRDELLSPSRETLHTSLPADGGVTKSENELDQPILSSADRRALRRMGRVIRTKLGGEAKGPHDIELGLQGDRIWLFQVRPFVENRKARGSEYLRTLDTPIDSDTTLRWDASLDSLRPR